MADRGPLSEKELAPFKKRLATISKELASYDELLREKHRIEAALRILSGVEALDHPALPTSSIPFSEEHFSQAIEEEDGEEEEDRPQLPAPRSNKRSNAELAREYIEAHPGCYIRDIYDHVASIKGRHISRVGVASPVSKMLLEGEIQGEGLKGKLRYFPKGQKLSPPTLEELGGGDSLNCQLVTAVLSQQGRPLLAREVFEEVRKYRPDRDVEVERKKVYSALSRLHSLNLVEAEGENRKLRFYVLKPEEMVMPPMEKTRIGLAGGSSIKRRVIEYVTAHPGATVGEVTTQLIKGRAGTRKDTVTTAIDRLTGKRKVKGRKPDIRLRADGERLFLKEAKHG